MRGALKQSFTSFRYIKAGSQDRPRSQFNPMTRHRAWMLGAGPIVLCLLLAAAGLLLVSAGASMAEFTDAERAQAVLHGDCPSDPRAAGDVGCGERWHRQTDELRTSKWLLYDSGRGLVAASVTMLVGIGLARLWDFRRWTRLRTPSSKLLILAVGAVIWIAQGAVLVTRLHEEYDRFYFPPWADTIFIPIALGSAFNVIMLPILIIVGWLVFLLRAQLPAGLWLWDRERPIRCAIWTLACAGLALLLLWDLTVTILYGSYLMVPLLLIGLYLILVARAAAVSRSSSAR